MDEAFPALGGPEWVREGSSIAKDPWIFSSTNKQKNSAGNLKNLQKRRDNGLYIVSLVLTFKIP